MNYAYVERCLAVCVPVWTLRFSSPGGSKCHHLQCLLLRAKANALRLNELSLTDFMHIMALTPTRLREIRAYTIDRHSGVVFMLNEHSAGTVLCMSGVRWARAGC